ncbi:amylo-alpha-1,6-glucosidase [Planosporangium flavigriseum]|uniref:Amylo-alpha-1,6-glucosidase n=1 Tax=Planosporangium flavigriseum TaxID=373681 RepID=A0A8J3LKF6_9ACTN|nr:glycogen debranching N-terminal domain-containing protein [Planosporangium flavigriseum]NJC66691.1 amylo-alpha-1,6-glucosidase [Planosporangium flavigriseum]GIG74843.1 amylo-alpha-1,6-glucosidase [Planosporangium flavigriseum]
MSEGRVETLDGNTFVVSDPCGDIDASRADPTGLFCYDTRFLSSWALTLDGQRLNALSTDDLEYFQTRFFLVPHTGTVYIDAKQSVIRQRTVSGGMHEQLKVLNHDDKPVEFTIRVEAGSDFADLFEVKDNLEKKGKYYTRIEGSRLLLGYERDSFRRETRISATAPARIDEHGLSFDVRVPAHGEWTTDLDVVPAMSAPSRKSILPPYMGESCVQPKRADLERWLARAPWLECDWESLKTTYKRSLVDLAALRFSPVIAEGHNLPAAGLPWYMTMFGRDSIFTSLQALPFVPGLAATTIRVLGDWQGRCTDRFRDEDPGRILHEMRYGELTAFEERPHSPYYGTADATPLYVVLLDEYERWTGDSDLARQFELEARAALSWIDEYADLMGKGYIAYQPGQPATGLVNQCWKDSPDAISYHDGRLPGFPRATCELQGYAYDAKRRGARLARDVWNDPEYADRLEREAADCKRRFNIDFWIPDRQYYALALDADGSQVDALSSNIGHLLWSRIVDDDKAAAVVEHLFSPELFSGWGVRTLAEGEGRYNPIGYHVGTVWPFDNSFIAWGLRFYGFKEQAARIAAGILDAAEFFEGRLPEAFAGYDRALTKYPVEYPSACSPQAWSTGAPLLLLRTMLGLEPCGEHVVVDPALPTGIGRIELVNIPGRWGCVDAFGRGRVEIDKRRHLRPQLGDRARHKAKVELIGGVGVLP